MFDRRFSEEDRPPANRLMRLEFRKATQEFDDRVRLGLAGWEDLLRIIRALGFGRAE